MSDSKNPEMNDPCRLYLISPAEIADPAGFSVLLGDVLRAGDVACFQLRLKDAEDETIEQTAAALMPVCYAHDVAFILNDRADLALKIGADGVHLGQSDGDVQDARSLLGFEASIGVTCHGSMHLAYAAGDAGADYVAFGAFYPSGTKDTEHQADVEILATWDEVTEIPCVAIGGITVETCRRLADAGAHFVAVSGGVWNYGKGPVEAVKDFNRALNAE